MRLSVFARWLLVILALGWFLVPSGATPLRADTSLIINGGFENGQSPWQESTANGAQLITSVLPHQGFFSAWLCGYDNCNDQLWQAVTLPASFSQVVLDYWLYINTQDAAGSPCLDVFSSRIRTASGVNIITAQTLCNGNATNTWVHQSLDLTAALSAYRGQPVQVYFQGTTDAFFPTNFFVDDVGLTVSAPVATSTPTQTATATATPTLTATATAKPTPTAMASASATRTPGAPTATPSASATAMPTGTATRTPTASATAMPSATPTATHVPPTATATTTPGTGGVVTQISADPYTNAGSQHRTQVEPDTFSFGSTIVAAVQSGRYFDGGASNIGWATSQNNGATWTHGFLPGTTVFAVPAGPFARISDPSVAYDARHNVWMIAALPLDSTLRGRGILVSRSMDGGLTWASPVLVSTTESGTDKDWIVCDNSASSPFYGHCYVEWDWNAVGNLIQMSTSTDGGLTWGPAQMTADAAAGLGGQPAVQPNGTVIVPIDDAFESRVLAFKSTTGGASWSSTTTVAGIVSHGEAGNLRSGPLPSAAIDAAGNVYVVWHDCRFEAGCAANDIVLSISGDGTSWSPVRRIPIDPIGSGVDHFIPGLAVAPATQGSSAHLGLAYYYYPVSTCGTTCQLDVGYVTSPDGGASWTTAAHLAGPMSLSWLAVTNQGAMVGDYISTSFSGGGRAFPAIALAQAPANGLLNEALDTSASGLAQLAGHLVSVRDEQPVVPLVTARRVIGPPRTAH